MAIYLELSNKQISYPSKESSVDEDNHNPTSNIIYNLAQLGIPLRDAELFDIGTYLEILDIHKGMTDVKGVRSRKATQEDIDLFLL